MKVKNYHEGDINPDNWEIKKHFFNLGEKGEMHWEATIGSNENVEIKTQDYSNTVKYGNLFVEHSAKYAGKHEFVPSGISITKCETWIFQFVDANQNYYPISININKDYLLKVIQKGLREKLVVEISTKNLQTGDTNMGYLVSIIYLLKELIENTHIIPKENFCNKTKPELTQQEKKQRLQEITKLRNEKNKIR